MKRPSILIITTKLPWPLFGGDRIRIFEQAKALFHNGWDVDLYASVQRVDHAKLEELQRLGVFRNVMLSPQSKVAMNCRALKSLWTKLPAQVEYFCDPHVEDVVTKSADQYDVLLFHHIRAVKPWLRGAKVPPNAVLDMHDSIARNYEMAAKFKMFPLDRAYLREARLLDCAEVSAIKGFQKVILISDVDRTRLLNGAGLSGRIVRVPISVREAAFKYSSKYNSNGPILFFGRLAYAPNRDAVTCLVQDIMPRIWKVDPKRECVVAGSEPPASIRKMCESDKRIHLCADVPDLYGTIEIASVVVAPIRYGAGMQNKVLESMAIGAPIVGTSFAFEGVGGQVGKHYFIGSSSDEIAAHVLQLLSSPARMREVGECARNYVKETFGQEIWNRVFVNEIEQMKSGSST